MERGSASKILESLSSSSLFLFFPSLLSLSFSMGKSQSALSDWSTQVSSRDRLVDTPPTAHTKLHCKRFAVLCLYLCGCVVDGLRVVGRGRPCCLNAHSQIYFLLYVFVSSVAYDPEPQHSGNRTQRSPFPTSQPRILCNAQPGKHAHTCIRL